MPADTCNHTGNADAYPLDVGIDRGDWATMPACDDAAWREGGAMQFERAVEYAMEF